jgi:hypothetical protein
VQMKSKLVIFFSKLIYYHIQPSIYLSKFIIFNLITNLLKNQYWIKTKSRT